MDRSPLAEDELRCPACAALVTADAEWCGQCFASLREVEPQPRPDVDAGSAATVVVAAPSVPGSGGAPSTGEMKAPTWPCPVCETSNAIEFDVCTVCGTPFAQLMRQDERPPEVEPKDALAWSLIFPGLGHRKVGRGPDGLARGVLFLMLFSMGIVVVISGVTSAALLGVFALFIGGALVVYFGSAYEAHQMAQGRGPLVSSRVLLWATVGVIMMSVALLALTVAAAARQ